MSESTRPPGFKVETLFALVSSDQRGEGIVQIRGPDGELHLLVDADRQKVAMLAPILRARGMKGLRIIQFTGAKDVTGEFLPEAES